MSLPMHAMQRSPDLLLAQPHEPFIQDQVVPGKRTLTEYLPRQRRSAPGGRVAMPRQAARGAGAATQGSADDPFAAHLLGAHPQQPASAPAALSLEQGVAVLEELEARDPGQPLPAELRAELEASFGADFSTVRVHQGPTAQALGAEAYTRGEHLFFGPGQYDPGSQRGRELLGHELAHVLQQRARAGAPASEIIMEDDGLEADADAASARAARGEPARAAGSASGGPAPTALATAPRQGRLIVRGDAQRIRQMLEFLGQWSCRVLTYDAQSEEVEDGGDEPYDPMRPDIRPYSRTLSNLLRTIIADEEHDALLTVNDHMLNTLLGGFPIPDDLTGEDDTQRINWGQIQLVAQQAPARAAAILAHEIAENHEAHQYPPRHGSSPMARAHEQGLTIESDVSQELGSGRRQGDSQLDLGGGLKIDCFEYETSYLVLAYHETEVPTERGAERDYDLRVAREVQVQELANAVIDMQHMAGDRIPDDLVGELRDATQATAVTTSWELKEELVRKGIASKRIKVRTPRANPQQAIQERVIVRMPNLESLRAIAQELRQPRQ